MDKAVEGSRIVTQVPGPRSQEWFERRRRAVAASVGTLHPIVTARASNAIIEDVDGNRFIDFVSGVSVLNVGHVAPEVVAAAERQMRLDTHTCFHVTGNEPYIELAEKLNEISPGGASEKKTMFANSGAEAVENAVKIARNATGRSAIAVFDHAFHGRTLLTMSLTAKAFPYRKGFGPAAADIYRLPFAYPYRCPTGGTSDTCAASCLARAIDKLQREAGTDNLAAVLLEPIQGEGGFIVPAPGFVSGIAEFCKQNGIPLIADEIQSGMGRTGHWYAIEAEDVVPDLVTTSKSLGGGFPISAVTGRADLLDAVHVGGVGGTFGGNPVAAAAALAVIDKIEREGLLERATHLGRIIEERLRELASRSEIVGDVRGRGAMFAIELVADKSSKEPLPAEFGSEITNRCLSRGLVVIKTGTYENVIRLLPPLTIEEPLLEEGLDILVESVGKVAA